MKSLRRPRKRTLLMLLLLLAGGAIINVAVAWGCAYAHGSLKKQKHVGLGGNEIAWGASRSDTFGYCFASLAWTNRTKDRTGASGDRAEILPCWFPASLQQPEGNNEIVVCDMAEAVGWPAVSLMAWIYFDGDHWTTRAGTKWQYWPCRGYVSMLGLLPTDPIWPGFAINTIFYAAILWMLFTFPFTLRRHRRIKRGLCPACAYPIGTSPVCTECGKPVQPRPPRGDGV